MAMCTSGNLSIKGTAGLCRSICAAVVAGGGSASGSLSSLSTSASKTAPHCMREFYGYNPVTYSISISIPNTNNFSGQIAFNTITASGAWSASKSDPNSIISSFTSTGSGGQKVTAGLTGLSSIFDRTATITYCLTASPSTTATWTITILAYN